MENELEYLYEIRNSINEQLEFDPDNMELWGHLDEIQIDIENIEEK